jgi:hypothetical protein
MKIREIIGESGSISINTKRDYYGGMIKLEPDPTIIKIPSRFSLSYINSSIAQYYKIDNRIIGLDSHGHSGKFEPHLHLFSKTKNSGYFKSPLQLVDWKYEHIIDLFYNLYFAFLKRYTKDITNDKNNNR